METNLRRGVVVGEDRAVPRLWTGLGLLMAVTSGCGPQDATLADVRGEVTLAGRPAIAEILFEPVTSAGKSAGRTSSATSDEFGRFRLMLDESQAGAKIGRHRVSIRVQRLSAATESGSATGQPEGVIGALKVTQLVREVQSGKNHFHFWLTF